MVIFRYRHFNSVKRPVAKVYLKSKSNKWIELEPIIDSGADVTLIPFSVGKLLGLTISEDRIEQIGGICGKTSIIYVQNKVKIGEVEFTASLGWSLDDNVPPLLGRADVFDRFNVTFKQKDGVIIFDEK